MRRSVTPTLSPEEQSPELPVPTTSELEFPLCSDEAFDLDNLQLQFEQQMQDKSQQIRFSDANVPNKAEDLLQQARGDRITHSEQDSQIDVLSPAHVKRLQAHRDRWSSKIDLPLLSSPPKGDQNAGFPLVSEKSPTSGPAAVEMREMSDLALENVFYEMEGSDPDTAILAVPSKHDEWLASVLDVDFLDHERHFLGIYADEPLDEGIMELASTAAHETKRLLKHETITEPERQLKTAVPELARVVVKPSWYDDKEDFLCHHLSDVRLMPDTAEDQQKQRQMQWSPFPAHLLQPGIEDSIVDDCSLSKVLEMPKKITQSNQMLYRHSRLRVLDTEDDSVEEIEEDPELARVNFGMLAPIKVVEAEEEPELDLRRDPIASIPTKRPFVEDNWLDQTGSLAPSSPSRFGNCPPRNALDSFLDLRGLKFRRANPFPLTRDDELKEDPIRLTQSDVELAFATLTDRVSVTSETKSQVQVPSTPIPPTAMEKIKSEPSLEALGWRRYVVVETAMLQQYLDMVKYLETVGSDQLHLIYRDMAVPQKQGSPMYMPDMILGPGVCLMLTTAQALSQRSLPGQGAGQNIVYTRISALSQDFERVLVLVSCSSLDFAGKEAQKRAIVSFEQKCADTAVAYGSVINPMWVDPDSILENINSWTWKLIRQYAYPADTLNWANVRLNDEQSSEETLLVTLGMNPMAAQIALLTCQGYWSTKESSRPGDRAGLHRLLQMYPKEISEMLNGALGTRMVERLIKALDAFRC
jgi:hypothetical protein